MRSHSKFMEKFTWRSLYFFLFQFFFVHTDTGDTTVLTSKICHFLFYSFFAWLTFHSISTDIISYQELQRNKQIFGCKRKEKKFFPWKKEENEQQKKMSVGHETVELVGLMISMILFPFFVETELNHCAAKTRNIVQLCPAFINFFAETG